MDNPSAWRHNRHLESILNALERQGPADLPPEEICKLLQYIKKSVLDQGRANNTLIVDDYNQIMRLPENGFQREISAMTVLAQHLVFSNTFYEWVDNRLQVLAHRMAREHNVEQLSALWSTMDQNGRLAYLRAVHVTQTAIFADDDLAFKPVPLKPVAPSGVYALGAFTWSGDILAKDCHSDILINPLELSKSQSAHAVGATIHETMHSILRQLARMHYHGDIEVNHPLYSDSRRMLEIVKHDSYIPSFFREAHKADPEERVCNKHRDFAALYEQQTRRRQILTDRIGPRPAL